MLRPIRRYGPWIGKPGGDTTSAPFRRRLAILAVGAVLPLSLCGGQAHIGAPPRSTAPAPVRRAARIVQPPQPETLRLRQGRTWIGAPPRAAFPAPPPQRAIRIIARQFPASRVRNQGSVWIGRPRNPNPIVVVHPKQLLLVRRDEGRGGMPVPRGFALFTRGGQRVNPVDTGLKNYRFVVVEVGQPKLVPIEVGQPKIVPV